MSNIHTNIKVLREEARLSKEEFAEKMDVSVETVVLWEKGKLDPTDSEIRRMCPFLRIHVEDFLERDILSERTDAGNRMKKGKTRSDYNWYLGSRTLMSFYISYLIIIPICFVIVFLLSKTTLESLQQAYPEEVVVQSITGVSILYSFIVIGFISGIYIFIYLFKKRIMIFRWWYIFWISAIMTIGTIIGALTSPILYVYAFYKGIIRRGRNR